jgi:hypothetical protein
MTYVGHRAEWTCTWLGLGSIDSPAPDPRTISCLQIFHVTPLVLSKSFIRHHSSQCLLLAGASTITRAGGVAVATRRGVGRVTLPIIVVSAPIGVGVVVRAISV